MSKQLLPESEIRRMAATIIESHTEDIEYLSIVEMTSDMVDAAYWNLEQDELEEVWDLVNKMMKKAVITITFED